MSYHIVTIESTKAELNCVDGQLVCKTAEGQRQLPLDDIAAIVVCCFTAKIEMLLLTEAAERGIGVVLCKAFKPACIMLPALRNTDNALTRVWERVPHDFLAAAWQKTIDAKCRNQECLARAWCPDSPAIAKIQEWTGECRPDKEAAVSRLYWGVFRDYLGDVDFLRLRSEGVSNCALDYGYAVLLARVLQACFACGLDPTFGIGHATAERSTPLAYDLMEPFRPLVDARVMSWLKSTRPLPMELDSAFKHHLVPFLQDSVTYKARPRQVQTVIELAIRSFRKCLLEQNLEMYEPWTATNSKWAGC